ncbi:MAG: serine protease [Deltaproteobacteria bacterium]|nr:serine protease [Deltaproteobacteria bacterium]
MEAARFLTATETGVLTALRLEGRYVVQEHQRLRDFLRDQGREDLANLFAEPLVGRTGPHGFQTVSWYTPLQGEMQSLADLPGDDRTAAESQLRRLLRDLEPFFSDPGVGRLLQRAVLVPNLAACKVVFGQVVLVDWGFCPGAPASDPRYFPSHWAATLGRFADFAPEAPGPEAPSLEAPSLEAPGPQPPVPAEPGPAQPGQAAGAGAAALGAAALGAAAGPASEALAAERPATVAAPEASAAEFPAAGGQDAPPPLSPGEGPAAAVSGPPPSPEPGRAAGSAGSSPPPGGGPPLSPPPPPPPGEPPLPWYRRWGVLLPLALLLLLALGWGLYGRWAAWRADEGRLRDLLEAREAVNRSLEEQIARQKELLTGDVCAKLLGATPSPVTAPLPPAATPAPAAPRNLTELLERSTVLVVAPTADVSDATMGTAFFVTPEYLVTNRHVVQKTGSAGVLITNKVLGQARRCTVVQISQEPYRDYALLKLDGPPAPEVLPLGFASGVAKLDQVVAAGYPGLITSDDPQFKALLLKGDLKAVPELVFSAGEVAVVLERQVPVIAHTAVVSMGNSGGPLVDRCGRVVGINTLIKMDRTSRHQGNYALAASDLLKFLHEHGVAVPQAGTRCPPAVAQ